MWGMQVYAGYFDGYNGINRLNFFPNGLVYFDSYAIYNPTFFTGSTTASQHPDWILKDSNNNSLYINYDCNKTDSRGNATGQCTQFAADVSNQGFINWYISTLQSRVNTGYHAVWIDDVNLTLSRVSDGNGNVIAPIDHATGTAMTGASWGKYFAAFLQQVRTSFPTMTILHNSIWYADPQNNGTYDQDPNVIKQIQQADLINLERGVNDAGITGGTGTFSLNNMLRFIDHVHALGKAVVLDGEINTGAGINPNDPIQREYALACYFLISMGKDAIGNDNIFPDAWWSGYDLDLGQPTGNRTSWNGLRRRDFNGGFVLVNDPKAQPISVNLGGTFKRVDGTSITKITLAGSQGVILLK